MEALSPTSSPLSTDRSSIGSRSPAPRLHTLTVLRFAAAFWILVFHLQGYVPLPDLPWWLGRFFVNGGFAMTIFFVLSGTVLAYGYHQLRATETDVVGFYRARFARIYVSYAVIQFLGALVFSPGTDFSSSKIVFINTLSLLGLQAWFPETTTYGVNNGTWSISAEFFFYALFPALLPLVRYLTRRSGALRVCFYVSALSGLIGLSDYFFRDAFLCYMLPVARLPEFILGMIIGLELITPADNRRTSLRLLSAVALAVGVILNPVLQHGFWIRANFYVVPACGWIIYALARWDQTRTVISSQVGKLLLYLGEISYSLFLVQLLPLIFFKSDRIRMGHADWLTHPYWCWAGIAAVSFLGAVILHEAIEKPARRALLRHWHMKPAVN